MKRGKKIKTLDDLAKAVAAKHCTVGMNNSGRPQPAAFIFSMQACRVHSIIQRGLWVYKSASSRKTKRPFPVYTFKPLAETSLP